MELSESERQKVDQGTREIMAAIGPVITNAVNTALDRHQNSCPLMDKQHMLEKQVNGNGQPGLTQNVNVILQKLSSIEATSKAEKEAQEQRHRDVMDGVAKKSMWFTFAAIPIGLAGLAVAILAIIASFWLAHHAEMSPSDLLEKFRAQQVYTVHVAPPPEDSALDNARRYTTR